MTLDGAGRRVANTLLVFSVIWVIGGRILWFAFRDSPVGPMMAAGGAFAALAILLLRFAKKRIGGAGRQDH